MEIPDLGIFLDYFGKIHERTMRVVRCIPPDHVDWSYRPGKFTLGDLGRHIAAINRYMYAETLQGKPSRYAGCGRELAPTCDEIISYMEARHSQSAEIISRLHQPERQMHDAGRHSHHRLEMAARHGRTRDPPSRPDLHLSRDSRSANPAALRPHVGAGCRPQRQRLASFARASNKKQRTNCFVTGHDFSRACKIISQKFGFSGGGELRNRLHERLKPSFVRKSYFPAMQLSAICVSVFTLTTGCAPDVSTMPVTLISWPTWWASLFGS